MTEQKTKYILPTLGVGKSEREEHDFYATNPQTVKKFLDKLTNDGIVLPKTILEPACGAGHISEILKEYGYKVISRDKYNRGYGKTGYDFLENKEKFYCIFTNPPYKHALKFVEKALECTNQNGFVIFLLRTLFLESKSRNTLFKKYPPKYIYVYSRRQICAKNADFERCQGNSISYSWFIWEKGFSGEPNIRWID